MAHSAYYIWFLTTVIVSHWHNWIETTHVINWDWKNSFKATIRVSCLTLFNQFILCCVWSTSTTTKTKKNEEVIGRFRVRVRESVFVWKRTRIHFNHIDACNRMNRFTSCWCNSFYIPVDLIPWKNGVIDEIEYHEMRSSILVFFFFFISLVFLVTIKNVSLSKWMKKILISTLKSYHANGSPVNIMSEMAFQCAAFVCIYSMTMLFIFYAAVCGGCWNDFR